MVVFGLLFKPRTSTCPPKRTFCAPGASAEPTLPFKRLSTVAGDGRNLPLPPFSTRNTSASRNRHNSPDINDITFSTRNKMTIRRRIVTLSDQRESKGPSADSTSIVALPALTQEGRESRDQGACFIPDLRNSNRNNSGNRNRCNSLNINDLIFSNRYKTGGLRHYVSAQFIGRRYSAFGE